MSEWKIGKTEDGTQCLSIGGTRFVLTNSETGRPAAPEILDQMAYEHAPAALGSLSGSFNSPSAPVRLPSSVEKSNPDFGNKTDQRFAA